MAMPLRLRLRPFLLRFRLYAAARARGAMLASAARGRRAHACAVGRVRAISQEGDAAYAAAVARARAALVLFLRAQRQAGAAGAVAAHRLRQASDRAVSTFLWIAYGESAPRTPSPLEILQKIVRLAQRAKDIQTYIGQFDMALELFDILSPYDAAFILSVLLLPVAGYYKHIVPTAPESVCPFLGLQSVEFEEVSVEEALCAVFYLAATCGGFVVLFLGGLCLCVCTDMGILAVIGEQGAQGVPHSILAWTYCDGQSVFVREIGWGLSDQEV